jgi:hypothetical protein
MSEDSGFTPQTVAFGEWREIPTTKDMSLRDYFAALAAQGMLANKYTTPGHRIHGPGTADQIPAAAYRFADAMLKARE